MVDQKEIKRIALFWENLFLFEAYLSINQGILNNNFVFPSFSDDGIKLVNYIIHYWTIPLRMILKPVAM